ncbi:MAG TPA: polyphenol oxidase family protein [Candidatus Eisenbacteria bacterium]
MTTRRGGVSEGPFATLNVGLVSGDLEERVAENRRRARETFGCGERDPIRARQVHGSRLLAVRPGADRGTAPEEPADGLLVERAEPDRSPCVAVSVADCAPVAVVSGDGTWAALLHSGWRGTLAGIASRAVERLARSGAAPETLRAVVGPCIHACCYPVGLDVAARFPTIHWRPHGSGQPALDLPGAIAASLAAAGVPAGRITVAPECTSCRADLFFSHRRDGGVTGRHWAMLRLGAER